MWELNVHVPSPATREAGDQQLGNEARPYHPRDSTLPLFVASLLRNCL